MNYNDSFGEDNNIIIKTIEKGDIAEDEKKTQNKDPMNTSFNNNNNDIFSSLPLEMKIDNEYLNSNNIYDTLLSKELVKYHLSNVFNIINTKTIILKTQTFYFLKKISNNKINNLIKAEILYLKISSCFIILSKIFKKNRLRILYDVLCKLKNKNKINDIFKLKFEIIYKKDKDNIINENNIKIKIIEKENKEIEKKIKNLNTKDNDLKVELNNLLKKEKQLNDKIKILENSKNSNTNNVKQQASNISSINNNSKYDSDILTLESTIETNKQIKERKEEIIKNFILKMNDLLSEYKIYIDMLKQTDCINNNKNNEINDNSNSKKQSLNQKECSGNTWHSSKSSGNQINALQANNFIK
jgi:hypothetical protein